MELLYHLDTGNLIWQVLLPQAEILPAIAGMLYMKNNSQYFNAAYPYIMTSCDCEDESKNEYQRIRDIDSLSKNWRCRSIDLCDTTEPQTCLKRSLRGAVHSEIPLTRRMYGPVFFDGRRFSEPRSFNYDDDDYDDYRQRYGKYAGSYAQDEAGLSDDFVNDVLDGDPDSFWNID